jgi:hypothetical protein
VQAVGRIGRRVGVGTGVIVGAVSGTGLGIYFGGLAAILVTLLSFDVAFFLVLPLCVLGGGVLGAWLFLRFRRSRTSYADSTVAWARLPGSSVLFSSLCSS